MKNDDKDTNKNDHGMKNGLALISIGCLMMIVMSFNRSTGQVTNWGIFVTSLLIIILGATISFLAHKKIKK